MTNKSQSEIWAGILFVFSLINSLVGLTIIESDMVRWTMISVTVILVIIGIILVIRSSGYHQAIRAMNQLCGQSPGGPEYQVENIASMAQLRELWRLDERCYGRGNIPFEVLESWWKGYRPGIHILIKDGRIAGAFGIFPIKARIFDKILEGKTLESEIDGKSIVKECEREGHGDWYVSGIVLDMKFRKSIAIKHLIADSLGKWLEEVGNPKRLRLAAFAYSRDGENLLRKFQFYEYRTKEETLSRYPVYVLETDGLDKLRDLLNRRGLNPKKSNQESPVDPENINKIQDPSQTESTDVNLR